MNKTTTLVVVSITLIHEGCQVKEKPVERHNILYITADDHLYKTISVYSRATHLTGKHTLK
ncbi:MAG TPA: hypothetical protein VKA38_05570 [Draconibacterium sp.]|nr:hypothetical protein [Draconibacterium sp.]